MAVISVIAKKGGTGKTPIAYNVAKATKSIILTNDDDILEEVHKPHASMLELAEIEELDFSKLPNTVIDFGGYVEKHIPAIIKKSDLVILPTTNNISSLKRNYKALEELVQYNANIIVVVTMTKKATDFDNVKAFFSDFKIKAFFELKDTNIFNNSLNKGMSIEEYIEETPILKSSYGKKKNQKTASILEQWNDLITYIKKQIKE
ncbi:MAG: hypothetical protein DRG78_17340 [Epsilonproteobacteria bacterium]|nr:MAG: hypothetical protein DRG78_17340 [Campylobacterota bacterium]